MRIDNLVSNQYLNKTYNIPSADKNTDAVGKGYKDTQQAANISVKKNSDVSDSTQNKSGNDSYNYQGVAVTISNKDNSLAGLGGLGGIQSNLMRDAVSQMKKDSLLHEYQYFVGNGIGSGVSAMNNAGDAVINNDEDGVIIRKN